MAMKPYAFYTEIEAPDAKRIGLRISLKLKRLNTNYWKEMGELSPNPCLTMAVFSL